MTDVFLSYAREDLPKARLLAAALESRTWTVWWDREIRTGERFDQVIEAALDGTRCVMVLWSATAVESSWVRNEAAEGLQRGVLLPVRLDSARVPLEFRRLQTSDLTDWNGQPEHAGFDQLCRDLERMIGRKAGDSSSAGASNTPTGRTLASGQRPRWLETPRQYLWRLLRARRLRWVLASGVLAGSLALYAFNPTLFTRTVTMPDVSGLTLTQARAVLAAAGLSGKATSGAELADPNVVLVESGIKPGTIVPRHQEINLRPLWRERGHFDYIAAIDQNRQRWRKTGDGTWAEAVTSNSGYPPIDFKRTERAVVDGNVGTVVRAGDRELDVFIPDIGASGNRPDWLRQRHGATAWNWVPLGQIVDPH